jgi:hypothetical protein
MEPSRSPRLAQIAADHVAVREAMQRLTSEVERSRSASGQPRFDELGRLLLAFRELLREHFAREERDDFFGQGIPWDPQARERIDQLITQHRQFLGRLDRLAQELDGLSLERLDAFAGEMENLFTNVRWHDAVETSLMKRLSTP